MILRRTLLKGLPGSVAVGLCAAPAAADDVLKMSVSIPLTGAGLNAVGPSLPARSSFTLRNVVGRRIELTVRDDGGVADNARPIMQDMIVNRKVGLIGIGIAPTSLAIAPLVTEAKIQLNCLGHRHQVALHGACRLSAKSAGLDHGRMGGQERQQARGDVGERLGAWH